MVVAIDKTTNKIVNAYHDNEFELEEGADSAKDDSLVKDDAGQNEKEV